MNIIGKGTLNQTQQIRAAIRNAALAKRAATNEARYIARQRAVEREVVGRSIRLAPRRGSRTAAPDFAAPAKRKAQYRSSTGLRAFHFGWSSVAKSSAPRNARGIRVYTNAAASHIVYIEDGAIAREGHAVYIDSSRVETSSDGERLVLSNISEHYEERVEFFRLVDQFERENHGDTAQIAFGMNQSSWESVTNDPECDPAVATAYARSVKSKSSTKVRKVTLAGSGSDLRNLMSKHGYVFADPVVNEERLRRDGFCFHDGRGGRTEYRTVFELPREFNREQRRRVLKLLCRRFKQAGCMYVAVIHAPDPHNDQDNYHIHLDFYDRRCRRLDRSDRNLDNVKPQFLNIIKDEIAHGRYDGDIRNGAWDFTVKRTYQSNKKKVTHRPFGAVRKSDDLRKRHFIMEVRHDFARYVNAVARKVELAEIYDPRDYAEMGLNRPASNKLGPKKHAQETKGIPTTIGIDNETAQAEFEVRAIEQAFHDQCRHLDEIQFRWQKVSKGAPTELNSAKNAVADELENVRVAAEIRRDLDLLKLEQDRERSRAKLVSDRQWRACMKGSAAAQASSKKLAESADDYLLMLDNRDVALLASKAVLEEFVSAHGSERAANAVLGFEREVHRVEADRQSRPTSDESSPPARRNIMVKRGTLARAEVERAKASHLPGTLRDVPSPMAGANPRVEAQASPSESSPPIGNARPKPSRSPAVAPGFAHSGAVRLRHSGLDEEIALARRNILVKRGVSERAAAQGAKTLYSPQPSVDQVAGPNSSIGLRIGAMMPDKLLVAEMMKSNGSEAQDKVLHDEKPGTVTDPKDSVADVRTGDVTALGSRLDAPLQLEEPATDDSSGSSVNPGSQTISLPATAIFLVSSIESSGSRAFHVSQKADEREMPSVAPDMDPIPAAKVLWLYGDLNPGDREKLRPVEKDMLERAEAHPSAVEIRAALAQANTNRQQALLDAKHGQTNQCVGSLNSPPNHLNSQATLHSAPPNSPAISAGLSNDDNAREHPASSHKKGPSVTEPEDGVIAQLNRPDSATVAQVSTLENVLLKDLLAGLGSERLLVKSNWRRYTAAPDGPDKDRLAFTINAQLQIHTIHRVKYPRLSELFSASDRHLEEMDRKAEQTRIARQQGGW